VTDKEIGFVNPEDLDISVNIKKSDMDKKNMMPIMLELDRLFLLYRGQYQQNPDTIFFYGGKDVKNLRNLVSGILEPKIKCEYVDTYYNEIKFMSMSNPMKKVKRNTGYSTPTIEKMLGSEMRKDGLVPYMGKSSIDKVISMRVSPNLNAIKETNEETSMSFPLKVSKNV